jgi:type II secretory pathway component GspD/PulD (secretin)
VHLKTLDAIAARGSVIHFLSRNSGTAVALNSQVASTTNALVVCDIAENVRTIVRLLAEADSESSIKTEVVTLKHVKAFDLVRHIQSASGKTVSVGMTEESPYVALTGSDADVKRVAALIAALDVEKD